MTLRELNEMIETLRNRGTDINNITLEIAVRIY